ncbi:radical SAM protein [Christensenellaceae bacterium OttesenSCG-928-K19]|nr:radical SAM protein [Christensenellaceae bacterium OttesenSCG-928-K19]
MELLRNTRSVCPVCLQNIPARLVRREANIYMEKSCPHHGNFSTLVWRGFADWDEWRGGVPPLGDDEGVACAQDCASCGVHPQGSCCVLLEVTRACNLSCNYCFADGSGEEPSTQELKHAIDVILQREDKPLIQFSGGEPTLRQDLPALVAYARQKGCKYTQLNTNGLLLTQESLVAALADAGLSFVFLQFDGTKDSIFRKLRGKPLLAQKLEAIRMCGKYKIGVTLVPTIVRGVNDGNIGEMVRQAAALSPAVRGIHFQPASYFGRYPQEDEANRYTLDELIAACYTQAELPHGSLRPSRCDHPGCGFHGSFLAQGESLLPLSTAHETEGCCCASTAAENREYIGRRWSRRQEDCCVPEDVDTESEGCGTQESADIKDMDYFLAQASRHRFTVTAMAFQDAMNLDVERLRRCSLHVYKNGSLLPFCSNYLTRIGETGHATT